MNALLISPRVATASIRFFKSAKNVRENIKNALVQLGLLLCYEKSTHRMSVIFNEDANITKVVYRRVLKKKIPRVRVLTL